MKKCIIICIIICTNLFSQRLEIYDFQTDVYSKSGQILLKKVNLDMIVIGRYVEDESYKIIDALNVVIGSFFAEDLFTSKGKEGLKKGLIDYTSKKHGLEIDDVYISKFFIENSLEVEKIVEALKNEGCCEKSHKQQIPLNNFLNDREDTIIVE